jgi:hypothetical protein
MRGVVEATFSGLDTDAPDTLRDLVVMGGVEMVCVSDPGAIVAIAGSGGSAEAETRRRVKGGGHKYPREVKRSSNSSVKKISSTFRQSMRWKMPYVDG